MNRIHFALCSFIAAFACVSNVRAVDDDNLLAVDDAFKVEAKAIDHAHIQLNWKVADTYYLYRNRIKVTSNDADVKLGTLDLPAGDKHHDEFFGDVEIYQKAFTATQPLEAPATSAHVSLTVKYQGCHQVDPKICFPPQTKKIDVALPAAAAAAASSAESPIKLGGNSGGTLLGNHLPLPPEQAFVYEAIATGPNEILARFTMPKGYYLYRDKTHFTAAGTTLDTPKWPAGENHTDENFGTTTVYFNQVEVSVPVTHADSQSVALAAEFQGCQDHGVCYPVMQRTVSVAMPVGTGSVSATNAAPAAGATVELSDEQQLAQTLSKSRLLGLLTFYVLGLLLAFTPCVFPMIPILSGIIAGAGDNISTRRAFVLSVVYVLASSVIFTIAGVIAGYAGGSIQALFQAKWILFLFSALFVVLSFSMFGFYELQLPSALQSRLAEASNRQKGGSLVGVFIMGLFSALIVGPCVAPPLAGAVLYIAGSHDPVFGGLALFVLSLGMGTPLIAVGTGAGYLLPRAGMWMDTVKAVFGVVFLWMALWIASRVISAETLRFLAACLLIGSGVYMGAIDALPEGASGWRKLWKSLGLVQVLLGAGIILSLCLAEATAPGSSPAAQTAISEVAFKRIKSVADFDRELAAAAKPVVLDFYADWCVSCKEMEKFTFSKPEVQKAMSGFVTLQADVTANDETDQALMKRFGVIAPPDTLFFGGDKQEKRALRLTGPEDADKFVKRLEAAAK